MQSDDRLRHNAPEDNETSGEEGSEALDGAYADHTWQNEPPYPRRPASSAPIGRERLGVVSIDPAPTPSRSRRRGKSLRAEHHSPPQKGRVARLIARLSRTPSGQEVNPPRRDLRETTPASDGFSTPSRQRVTAFAQSDRMTRMLVYGAGGIGAVLALIVGVRSLLDGHRGEIAIIAPPPVPVREKPLDPGGMHVLSGIPTDLDETGTGRAQLAPGPEQPKLAALAARYAASKPTASETSETPPARQEAPPDTDAGAQRSATAKAPVSMAPDESSPAPSPPSEPSHKEASPKTLDTPVAMPTPEAILSAAPPTRSFYIQLGAVNRADKARQEWGRIARRMSGQLSRRPVYIVPKLIRGQMLYRIWVGGYPSPERAIAACNAVKTRKLPCYAVRR